MMYQVCSEILESITLYELMLVTLFVITYYRPDDPSIRSIVIKQMYNLMKWDNINILMECSNDLMILAWTVKSEDCHDKEKVQLVTSWVWQVLIW
jgi:hypothetical protein